MKTLTLSTRTVSFDGSWDVIVAGGGPSGCTAAAAAARDGARTLLVEATGCLGGMATAGLVTCWCPFSDGEKMIYRGLAERIFKASLSSVPHVPSGRLDWVPFDPERLKVIYDDLLAEAGVTVLFNTQVAALEKEDAGALSAIVLANKKGLQAYAAKVYVDCTGDGDLAAWAGAECRTGDERTGELQPVTHCFALANVDTYAYEHGGRVSPEIFARILESGRYPLIKDGHCCNSLIGPGTVGFNSGHLWEVDNTDPESVSRALAEGRKLARSIRDALAEFSPAAFAGSSLVMTAPLMGIRETRRVIGDYVLTLQDYLERRTFGDEIARNAYPIDIHTTSKEARTGEHVNAMKRYENYKAGESHGIPYRCLTPSGLRNLLVAGRCISTERAVQGSTRVMPVCLCMGEAAGAAAVQAAATGNVHTIDTDQLRSRLRRAGAWLP